MVNTCELCQHQSFCLKSRVCMRETNPQLFTSIRDYSDSGGKISDVNNLQCVANGPSVVNTIEMQWQDVVLEPVSKEQLSACIRIAYEGDMKMQQEYHIVRGTLDEQIEYTYKQSIESDSLHEHKYCQVVLIEESGRRRVIGYSTLIYDEIKLLHTFGININFRSDHIKKLWLSAVSSDFENDIWFLTLRERNKRAIGFFEKNNFCYKLINGEDENFYLLWQQQ